MAIGTGTVAFSDLRDEYQDSNPVALGDYYANGTLLPNIMNTIYAIPTAGAISVDDFRPSTLTWGITAGQQGTPNVERGYIRGSIGTLDKDTIDFDTVEIDEIVTLDTAGTDSFYFELDGSVAAGYWTTMNITGTFAGGTNPRTITYTEATLTRTVPGNTRWTDSAISPDDNLVNGNTYEVEIIK